MMQIRSSLTSHTELMMLDINPKTSSDVTANGAATRRKLSGPQRKFTATKFKLPVQCRSTVLFAMLCLFSAVCGMEPAPAAPGAPLKINLRILITKPQEHNDPSSPAHAKWEAPGTSSPSSDWDFQVIGAENYQLDGFYMKREKVLPKWFREGFSDQSEAEMAWRKQTGGTTHWFENDFTGCNLLFCDPDYTRASFWTFYDRNGEEPEPRCHVRSEKGNPPPTTGWFGNKNLTLKFKAKKPHGQAGQLRSFRRRLSRTGPSYAWEAHVRKHSARLRALRSHTLMTH